MGGTTHPSLLFALTYGFLTALTPCVYPMIPITISIFGARTGVPRRRAIVLATCYVAGIAVMFGALGTTFALLGKAFGTFLANPWVIVPLALFFVAMGLSMFGAFELALPTGLQSRLSRVGGGGFFGAFLMGLVGGIIAAPCTGPPLASLLAYVATTRDAVWGMALLATYGAGVGLPFFLLAAFSLSLPKPGPWMEWVKSAFGIALFTAALYYLKNVVPALDHFASGSPRFLLVMGALVLAGLALGAIHASFPRIERRTRTQRDRRRPVHAGPVRRDELPACAQGRDRAGLADRRDGRRRGRARQGPAAAGRFFGRAGACRARSSRCRSSRGRRSRPRCGSSRCCVSI